MSICRIPALLFLELYQMIGRMRNSAPADATLFLLFRGYAWTGPAPNSKVWQMSYKFIRHFGMKKL